jgi:hypothetical protein
MARPAEQLPLDPTAWLAVYLAPGSAVRLAVHLAPGLMARPAEQLPLAPTARLVAHLAVHLPLDPVARLGSTPR